MPRLCDAVGQFEYHKFLLGKEVLVEDRSMYGGYLLFRDFESPQRGSVRGQSISAAVLAARAHDSHLFESRVSRPAVHHGVHVRFRGERYVRTMGQSAEHVGDVA